LIVCITAVFALSAVVYALTAQQWYKAEVVLVPAKKNQGLQAQLHNLAGLASIAGVNIGDKSEGVEALAMLKSNGLARKFIHERKLLPILFADKWDSAAGKWKSKDPEDWPDDRDAVRYFKKVICQVSDDNRTGLVTVSIEWKDREVAAQWANALVELVNEQMRQRALTESEQNAKFLRDQLSATSIATLQLSISRLLENELQTLMLARGTREFAFHIVDPATPPKWRSRPKRTLLVCVATLGGAIFSVVLVLLIRAWRQSAPPRAADGE
ncbi:MAG TPA: Wzz/FepE/Etk N-terminal domain-containing protein, partial [Terriglobales bacterium]|nr:Wzz/FepE/Etk N-terminal domain-containing protein [Terriglobales bacterium]